VLSDSLGDLREMVRETSSATMLASRATEIKVKRLKDAEALLSRVDTDIKTLENRFPEEATMTMVTDIVIELNKKLGDFETKFDAIKPMIERATSDFKEIKNEVKEEITKKGFANTLATSVAEKINQGVS